MCIIKSSVLLNAMVELAVISGLQLKSSLKFYTFKLPGSPSGHPHLPSFFVKGKLDKDGFMKNWGELPVFNQRHFRYSLFS